MKIIPHGMWKSPIDEDFVAHRGRISCIHWDTQQSHESLVFSGSKDGKNFCMNGIFKTDCGTSAVGILSAEQSDMAVVTLMSAKGAFCLLPEKRTLPP